MSSANRPRFAPVCNMHAFHFLFTPSCPGVKCWSGVVRAGSLSCSDLWGSGQRFSTEYDVSFGFFLDALVRPTVFSVISGLLSVYQEVLLEFVK